MKEKLSIKQQPRCIVKKVKAAMIKRNWDFIQPEDYKLIPITQGKFVKVDNEDFEKLKDINWCFNSGYAKNRSKGKMHRFIMYCPENMVIDHINHDTLDNRKKNLRICTHKENSQNLSIKDGFSSKYKGVSFYKQNGTWESCIFFNNKKNHLGRFDSEIEAAKAYDKKAVDLFGEFALTNFN